MAAAAVSAATGVMCSLLGKLSALLGQEYKLLKGVRKEIEFLKRELSSMDALMQTLAGMEELDSLTKDWRDKVRELSYDMEDCIDLFMHLVRRGHVKARFARKVKWKLKSLWARHEVARQVQHLKARVAEESQRRERYKIDNRNYLASVVEDVDPRLPALYADAKGLVAVNGPRDQIVGWLMDETAELKVVTIVGCGGLGKTTLAMEVYRTVGEVFQCRASVSVSRTFDLKKLLKDILYQLNPEEYDQSQSWEKEQLILRLRGILKDRRYMIVVDDLWRIQDWELVKSALPQDGNFSRVLITTRIVDVAKLCCSNSGDQLHEMARLDLIDSETLFFRRIFHCNKCCPAPLQDISNRILRKCGGFPLAIITLAGLLANKSETKEQWEMVLHSIGSTLEIGGELHGMRNILLLSYRDLNYNLKTCLLYMSIYPEDYEIDRKQLIWKWIAEGYITERRGQSLESTAESYFCELVNRSMIQPIDIDYDGLARACRIHDMVLQLIVSLSTEQNLVTIYSGHNCSSPSDHKIRRLSVQSCTECQVIQAITSNRSHIRSLSSFGSINIPQLSAFHALRVLDFDGCERLNIKNEHIANVGRLVQLRYLRFSSANISVIPEEIGKLKCLETLDLRGCGLLRKLPPTIAQMKKLVRLFVDEGTELPHEIGEIQSLEELSDVTACDNPVKFVEQLGRLTKLRTLWIDYRKLVKNCAACEMCSANLVSSLHLLVRQNLRSLWIFCEDSIVDSLIGIGSCCTLAHLERLEIGHWPDRISRVPKGMACLANLVDLRLNIRKIEEEDICVLMAMPTLHLLHVYLYDAPGKRLVIGNQGFQCLREFLFHSFSGGMVVPFAPGAMPALQRLHLGFSVKETFSDELLSRHDSSVEFGLEHLVELKNLTVWIYGHGAVKSVAEADAETAIRKAAELFSSCLNLEIVHFTGQSH